MLETRRRPVEQTFDADLGSLIAGVRLRLDQLSIFNDCPGTVIAIARDKCHPGNRSDRRQRLPAEAHRMNVPEIILRMDLARSVAAEARRRIRGIHSASVIADRQLLAAALDSRNDNLRTARIDRIFNEFLGNAARPLHDLARSDHICRLCIKLMNPSHTRDYTPARSAKMTVCV